MQYTFGNPDFRISEFHVSKALFCSNISDVLQKALGVTRLDSKRSNTLALYIPTMIKITCSYLIIESKLMDT